jgi:small subunit ribosomal protein S1
VLESYKEGDTVDGKVTKVVTFGAFVEILPGVEGLVHISELAQHHVENPREVVSQGDNVKVLILEVDAERRRLSLSLKRVEGNEHLVGATDLDLSEDVFADEGAQQVVEMEGALDDLAEAEAGEQESLAADAEELPAAEPVEPADES